MSWSFAIINNRLAEIYFDEKDKKGKPKIWGHCSKTYQPVKRKTA